MQVIGCLVSFNPDKGWFNLQNDNLDNLRNWGYLVEEYVSRKETDEIIIIENQLEENLINFYKLS